MKQRLKTKSDFIGILVTGLCTLHCAATPLIVTAFPFVSQSYTHHGHDHVHGGWLWESLDIVFLVIGFFAIRYSIKHSSTAWVQYLFWFTWIGLAIGIGLDRIGMGLGSTVMYIASFALIALHIFNYSFASYRRWKLNPRTA